MKETSSIWTGKATLYDQARPTPPPALLDLLTQEIDTPYPELIVDLGCGTGLSTTIWNDRARKVIGIEPNADMRAQAIQKTEGSTSTTTIEYHARMAHATGLPDACADIVTCSQSFHWMEPTTTLAEIARILRPGGLFAAYDYDWPPTLNWELEQMYQEMNARTEELLQERGFTNNLQRWPKQKHLEQIRTSGHFRFSREIYLHHVEYGNAERFITMLQTNGYSHQFQLQTITEQEIGFERLMQATQSIIGSKAIPWYIGYRVRFAIK